MVLFFLVILFIINIFIILNSKFKLSVNKLIVNTEIKQYEYEIKFGLYFINKIKIIGFKIDNKKIEKIKKKIINLKKSKLISKIDLDRISIILKEKVRKDNVKILKILNIIIKNLKLKINKYNMNLEIGIDDAFLNSILISIISTLISIMLNFTISNKTNLNKIIKNYDFNSYSNNRKKFFYKISPIYGKRKIIKLNLNCIITLKMVHIINIIYLVNKEGRSDKYVRTSNRKSYDYCNE